jgi:hypothetical protein
LFIFAFQRGAASRRGNRRLETDRVDRMGKAFQITTEQDSIVIRLSRQTTDPEMLTRLLDFLETETIRRRSQLDPDAAAELGDDVARGAWEQVRHLFER